jgi:hypothetical protein
MRPNLVGERPSHGGYASTGDGGSSIGQVSDHDYNFTSEAIMSVVKRFGNVKLGGASSRRS